MIKKEYKENDPVWIHGIARDNRLTEGRVIAQVDLSEQGFHDGPYYVIGISSHIETLLEIRNWHTMSQDEHGPIGSFREIGGILPSDNKKMRQTGYVHNSDLDTDDQISPEQIMAALEHSVQGTVHKPLHIKENKPKRKYFPRKKKL